MGSSAPGMGDFFGVEPVAQTTASNGARSSAVASFSTTGIWSFSTAVIMESRRRRMSALNSGTEASVSWPPFLPFSKMVTSWPRSFSTRAVSRPAGPAPTTAMFRFTAAGVISSSPSRLMTGFTAQVMAL